MSCESYGHYAQDCENNRARGKAGACFRCGKVGHRRKDCETNENDFEDVVEVVNKEDSAGKSTNTNHEMRSKSYADMLNMTPHEKFNKLLDQKFQDQLVLTLKFQVVGGMKLVKEAQE